MPLPAEAFAGTARQSPSSALELIKQISEIKKVICTNPRHPRPAAMGLAEGQAGTKLAMSDVSGFAAAVVPALFDQ
jgi:hypothetical protein